MGDARDPDTLLTNVPLWAITGEDGPVALSTQGFNRHVLMFSRAAGAEAFILGSGRSDWTALEIPTRAVAVSILRAFKRHVKSTHAVLDPTALRGKSDDFVFPIQHAINVIEQSDSRGE